MIYKPAWTPWDLPGGEHRTASVFDAKGQPITDVLFCNTETGEVCWHDVVSARDICEKRPAPLDVIFDK